MSGGSSPKDVPVPTVPMVRGDLGGRQQAPVVKRQDQGPYLHIAAFWLERDETERVAEVLREADFPAPDGFQRGRIVAFRHEVADSVPFRRALESFDLAELNDRGATTAGMPSPEASSSPAQPAVPDAGAET